MKCIIIGLIYGIVGAAAAVAGILYPQGGIPVCAYAVPILLAALFTCPMAGVVSGFVTMIVCALMPLFVPEASVSSACAAGAIVSTIVSVIAAKWMFYGERPAFAPAATVALIAEELNLACVVMMTSDNAGLAMVAVGQSFLAQCIAVAAIAAVASFVFRARQNLKANLTYASSVLVIAVSLALIRGAQERIAIVNAEDMVASLKDDAVEAVEYPIETEMLRTLDKAMKRFGGMDALARADAAKLAADLGFPFLAIVDSKGKVIGSSDPAQVGFELGSSEEFKDFLDVFEGNRRYVSQSFRRPERALAGLNSKTMYRYAALAYRDRSGFVLIADEIGDPENYDYILQDTMNDWHIGENGSYYLVNPATSVVVSGLEAEFTGLKMSEVGLDNLQSISSDKFMTGCIHGENALVCKMSLEFCPLDVYMVIPYTDIMRQRDFTVLMSAMIFAAIFLFVAMFLSKIFKQGRVLDEMRRKEDERRQKDMEQAKSIQLSSLVTEFPAGVHAMIRTAREVGGDFYDTFMLDDTKMMLVMADVSGKGIPAALFMMRAKTEFRGVSIDYNGVSEIMSEVNSRLCQNNIAEMFVTAWIGILDTKTGELSWTSAGHNPPYIIRADGKVEQLVGKRSLVLAGMDGVRYQANSATLQKGDRLFLYTDGVTEAQSIAGDFYGENRLEEVLGNGGGTSADTCKRVFESVDHFAEKAPQADDITVMAIDI